MVNEKHVTAILCCVAEMTTVVSKLTAVSLGLSRRLGSQSRLPAVSLTEPTAAKVSSSLFVLSRFVLSVNSTGDQFLHIAPLECALGCCNIWTEQVSSFLL